jgi:anthranilate phosphoribosyltransferase
MARGPSRGRNLDRDEARDAMTAILAGKAAPEAVGALFMLMRYRGEVAAEIAGFVDAVRARLSPWRDVGAVVDWPSYAAGRTRGLPLFLLAAKLVARSGCPVLLHGWNSHMTHPVTTLKGVEALGLAVVNTPEAARVALAADGIAYVPLDALDGEALRLLRLRDVLGLRSPLNTALRALNPGGAATSVQGVFHPTYRALQADAACLLGQPAMGVIKGGGGEFERHPGKGVELYGYNSAGAFDEVMAPLAEDKRRMRPDHAALTPAMLTDLWSGAREDAFERDVVIATAGAALFIAGAVDALATAERQATKLWDRRND